MKRSLLPVVYLCIVVILRPENAAASSPLLQAVVFTVTTTDDLDDSLCDTQHCSLREAISAANATPESDTITFSIPGSGPHTIGPTVGFVITAPVMIDATTQPDYTWATPQVELVGEGSVGGSGLLELRGGNSTVRGLVINGSGAGIEIAEGGGYTIQANFIGLEPYGQTIQANSYGILVTATGSAGNIIGGPDPSMANVISGNDYFGIELGDSSSNTVEGNIIGLDKTGTALPAGSIQQGYGISLGGSSNSIRNNVISGHSDFGIFITSSLDGTRIARDNTIQGNRIGTDTSGMLALGNGQGGPVQGGIAIAGGYDNLIGGTTPAERNLISANNPYGIWLTGYWCSGSPCAHTAAGNQVLGNYIGTNVSGMAALGTQEYGVYVEDLLATSIGGNRTGQANVISGNTYGIYVARSIPGTASSTQIIYNIIGLGADGTTAVPNSDGVRLGPDATAVNIQWNRIGRNTNLGIDLSVPVPSNPADGVTPNDAGDTDMGPNNLQNYPVLSSFLYTDATSTITGTLNSTPNTVFRIQLFTNTACDASGYGEGERNLYTLNVTTNGLGSAAFSTAIAADLRGKYLTATAADPNGNTSEFSACLQTVQASFTVTKTEDTNDGVCDADCSLREAITAANATPVSDMIAFNIAGAGPHTITPTTALPTITTPVMLDGTTQPGYTLATPMIELNGESAGTGVYGLHLSGGSTVRGLVINRFSSGGILVQGTSNIVEDNVIGLGGFPLAVLQGTLQNDGVTLEGAQGSWIKRNVISGNTAWGIYLHLSSGNYIVGNLIGTDPAGGADMGNGSGGIRLHSSANNQIGRFDVGGRNLISGNPRGIEIESSGVEVNILQNNFIGTDITGSIGLGNDYEGVVILQSTGTQVLSNVISGNDAAGVRVDSVTSALLRDNTIGLSDGGLTALPNAEGIRIGPDARGVKLEWNNIGGNTNLGIDLSVPVWPDPADGATPNDAGDTDTGPNNLQNFPILTSAIANGITRVDGTLNSAPDTLYRVELFSNTACDPSGYGEGEHYEASSYVTTDSSGNGGFTTLIAVDLTGKYMTAVATDPNGNTSEFSSCILVEASIPTTYVVTTNLDTDDSVCDVGCSLREAITASNTHPGKDTIAFNIPGEGPHTIQPTSRLPDITNPAIIDGTTQPGYTGTPLIELDGTLAGYASGVSLNVNNNTVRGLAINRFDMGIHTFYSSDNVIAANFIGTDPTGTIDLGNRAYGIFFYGESYNNRVGGPDVADRNIISGNRTGIQMPMGGTGHIIQNNYIGTDRTGMLDLGNDQDGLVIWSAGTETQVLSNVISGNGGAGVVVSAYDADNILIEGNTIGLSADGTTALPNREGIRVVSNTSGARIQGNRIGGNLNLGIDLSMATAPDQPPDGVTANDPGDADTGPNNLQNFPVLSGFSFSGTTSTVTGTLNSTPNSTFRVELFANTACDASGYGEGEQYVYGFDVTTDGSGNAAFSPAITSDLRGKYLTATATDPLGNTSEFSGCLYANPNVLSAPTNLAATPISRTQINLNWTDIADESEYHIERSADGGATWTQIGTTEANVTSYSDTGLTCSTSYTYRVIAYRSSDGASSAPSTTASATTFACPVNLLVNPSFESLTQSRYLPPASPPMVIVQSMQLGVTQEGEQIGGLAVPPATQRGMPYGWSEQNLNPLGTGNGWACSSVVHDGLCALRIRGNGQLQTVSQTVSAGGRAGDTYTLRFWSRGSALTGVVRARVMIFYPDGTSRTGVRTLPLGSYDWQEQILRVTPRRPYIRIEVVFEFQGTGTWWLDHTFLGRE